MLQLSEILQNENNQMAMDDFLRRTSGQDLQILNYFESFNVFLTHFILF